VWADRKTEAKPHQSAYGLLKYRTVHPKKIFASSFAAEDVVTEEYFEKFFF
jgi:hypothetical protein